MLRHNIRNVFLSQWRRTGNWNIVKTAMLQHRKLMEFGNSITAKHQQMYQVITAEMAVPFCHRHLERDLYNPMTRTLIVPPLGNIACDLQSTHQ